MEIRERLEAWFAERLGVRQLDPHENLFDRGLLDSLNALELVMHLEATFGIRVGPLDMVEGNFRTLDDLTRYVSAKKS